MSAHVPTAEDPAAEGASQLIGGRWGRHATRTNRWWLTPLEIAMAITILVLVGGYLQKAQCLKPTGYADNYQYTRLCYTDTYVLYTADGLNADVARSGPDKGQVVGNVGVPYRDHRVEYPPVMAGLMWTAAELTSHLSGGGHADPSGAHGQRFFQITALGLALCALITVFATGRMLGRRRQWDLIMLAASPVLFMHAFTNWDLVAVACTALGMWLWSRKQPALAGVLFGLGVATKLYPVLVLLAILMLCTRERAWRAALMAIAGAAGGILVMYVPAWAISHGHEFRFPTASCTSNQKISGYRFFTSLSEHRGVDWGSLWLVVQHATDSLQSHFTGTGWLDTHVHYWLNATNSALSGPKRFTSDGKPIRGSCHANPTALNWISSISVGLVIAGVAALIAFARRRPRVAPMAFLLVAGFIMLNKVDSPQYALWLVPLAVLARPKWASLLVWQVAEVILGAANLYQLIAQEQHNQGLPIGTYLVVVVIRDVILVWLMAMMVREALNPRLDIVRRDGVDDPVGGILCESEPPPPDPDPAAGELLVAPA